MKRKKSYITLIIGTILIAISILVVINAYKNSYQESTIVGKKLSDIKTEIAEINAGNATGDLETLNNEKSTLEDQKLSLERPYSYGLTLLFIAIIIYIKGLYNAFIGTNPDSKPNIMLLSIAGLMAALCYIGFAFFKIDIPVGTEKTAFHFGNVFCVLAALLIGGFWGGLAGAVGMTIGDLTTAYVTSAPKTFLLKFMIGIIVGFVAHKIFKLSRSHSSKYVTGATIVASSCGMLFNVIADPLVGYFYKMYLLGVPQKISSALAKMSAVTTFVNAVVAVIAASIFYLALRPALKKSGLFIQVSPAVDAPIKKEA